MSSLSNKIPLPLNPLFKAIKNNILQSYFEIMNMMFNPTEIYF